MKRAENARECTCGGALRCIDSRPIAGYRLRRFQCEACAARSTTVEVPVEDINNKAGLPLAISRVTAYFVQRAPTVLLLDEMKRRE